MKAFIYDLPDSFIVEKSVLVRADLNIPLGATGENGLPTVGDTSRIEALVPTIRYLLEKKARVICICSHLGRPSAGPCKAFSLQAILQPLRDLLVGSHIDFVAECVGSLVSEAVKAAKPGTVLLLENTRFHSEEESNNADFARTLASPFQLFVNDAFGSAHRAHASTEGVAKFVQVSVGGLLMEKEVSNLTGAMKSPVRPFAAVIGGAKVSTKIDVLFNLLQVVDKLFIGGAMAFTFYRSLGFGTGNSLVDEKYIPVADKIIREAEKRGVALIFATDVVIADSIDTPTFIRTVHVANIPETAIGLDIGDDSIRTFRCELEGCKTIVWNGPMGAFERPQFQKGTYSVMEIVSELTCKGATTIVCGGDTVAAVNEKGGCSFSLVSTGGGATLEFIEGRSLPGVDCLCSLEDLDNLARLESGTTQLLSQPSKGESEPTLSQHLSGKTVEKGPLSSPDSRSRSSHGHTEMPSDDDVSTLGESSSKGSSGQAEGPDTQAPPPCSCNPPCQCFPECGCGTMKAPFPFPSPSPSPDVLLHKDLKGDSGNGNPKNSMKKSKRQEKAAGKGQVGKTPKDKVL